MEDAGIHVQSRPGSQIKTATAQFFLSHKLHRCKERAHRAEQHLTWDGDGNVVQPARRSNVNGGSSPASWWPTTPSHAQHGSELVACNIKVVGSMEMPQVLRED
eukprot:1160664-Pelagomonas_calceolata.AAC.4